MHSIPPPSNTPFALNSHPWQRFIARRQNPMLQKEQIMQMRTFAIAAAFFVLALSSTAATPDQVGTYTGTLTGKIYTLADKSTLAHKDTFLLTILANNTVIVQPGNAPFVIDNVAIGASNGYIDFVLGNTRLMLIIHFKGTIKGEMMYTEKDSFYLPPGQYMEAKISLKKQP
jgi:hypothetical protein